MSVRSVTQIGDKVLRNRAEEVGDIHAPEIRELIQDLIDTMRATNLIGIAAPQIGVGKRVFVTEIRGTKYRDKADIKSDLVVYINPTIVSESAEVELGMEGCGSVCHADLFGEVRRPNSIIVQAFNLEGVSFTLQADGLLGRCIQHEMDHLNGTLCIDKFFDTRKLMSGEHYRNSKK